MLATRLAWSTATRQILFAAEKSAAPAERSTISTFNKLIEAELKILRDSAFQRESSVGTSPIDAHVQDVIRGVPELISPDEHARIGAVVTSGFTYVLAVLSGWPEHEVPQVYADLAQGGLAISGSTTRRSFGELVFAAFAELIKDPRSYPEAREAFYIAMDRLGREIGLKTLAAVQGLDDRIERLTEGLDALTVLRNGANEYLVLIPQIAEGVTATNTTLFTIQQQVDQLVNAKGDHSREFGVKEGMLIALARRYDG